MYIDQNQKGKLFVVVGASGELGLNVSKRLAKSGADLILTSTNANKLKYVSQNIRESIGVDSLNIHTQVLNICIDNDMEKFSQFAKCLNLCIDGCIISSGVNCTDEAHSINTSLIRKNMSVNLFGTVDVINCLLPYMKKQNSSFIVIASASAHKANIVNPTYAISKSALISTIKQLARKHANKGIRFNTISPSIFYSGMTKPILDSTENRKSILDSIPLGRIGTSDEIADIIINLLVDSGSWVTGQDIVIDGGSSLVC